MSNIIVSGIFVVLSLLIFLETRGFPSYEYSYMNSATFPRMIAILMILFSILLIIRDRVQHRKNEHEKVKGNPPNLYGLLGLLVTIVYVFLVKLLGFLIPTALILITYSTILQKGKFRLLDTIAIPAIGLVLIVVMFYFLNVPLMRGTLF